MRLHTNKVFKLSAVFSLLILSNSAFAGGMNIYELGNATDVGTAGAGLTAKAQDASVVFNNPAGMTRIKRPELFVGVTGLYLDANFSPDDETTMSGKDGDASMLFAGGGMSYVHPLDNDVVLGISMQNYMGLTLDWEQPWVGRYSSNQEWLLFPQIQPTIGYKVNDWLSVGAGVGLTVGYLKSKSSLYNPDTEEDGGVKFSDTDFGVQGNFGLMFEPNQDLRIGMRYLTQSRLEFEDKLSLTSASQTQNEVNDALGNTKVKIYMPQSLNIDAFYQIDSQWAILGGVGWEDWSQFGKVNIGFDETGSTTVKIKTKDIYHFGIGTQYQLTPKWLLEAGFSFDTELTNGSNRPISLPLGDMYRYGTGFKYSVSDDLTIGAGLELMWEGDLEVASTSNDQGYVAGEYTDVYFIFGSAYASWKF